jgi:hypothetical protein
MLVMFNDGNFGMTFDSMPSFFRHRKMPWGPELQGSAPMAAPPSLALRQCLAQDDSQLFDIILCNKSCASLHLKRMCRISGAVLEIRHGCQ